MYNSRPLRAIFICATYVNNANRGIMFSIFRCSAHEIWNHLSRIQNNGIPPYGFICVHLAQQAAYSYHPIFPALFAPSNESQMWKLKAEGSCDGIN